MLFQNKLSVNDTAALTEALSYNSALRKVDLRACLGSGKRCIHQSVMVGLAEALQRNSTIEQLLLGFGEDCKHGDEAFGETLASNATLRKPSLSYVEIDGPGPVAVARALLSNMTLEELEIEDCGEEGELFLVREGDFVGELGKALACNTSLKKLHLRGNGFRPWILQIEALACALETNTTLGELVLSRNVDLRCGSAVGKALTRNSSLKKLHVDGCNMGEDGVVALAKVLWNNTTLEDLDLGGNSFGNAGAMALSFALSINRGLRKLGLGTCDQVPTAEDRFV